MSKNALGRGLSSLIPPQKNTKIDTSKIDESVSVEDENIRPDEKIYNIDIDLIEANPNQPRKEFDRGALWELATSIKRFGILQPLIVRKFIKNGETRYCLIAGERRLRASKLIELKKVPVVIRDIDGSNELEVSLVENVQRADLNIIERAEAFKRLAEEFDLNQIEIAERVGVSRETVTNTLRILSLPSRIVDALRKNQINFSEARILLYLKEPELEIQAFEKLINEKLTVQELDSEVKKMIRKIPNTGFKSSSKAMDHFDSEMRHKFNLLEERLNTHVEVASRQGRGRLIIHFYSQDEFGEMLDKLLEE